MLWVLGAPLVMRAVAGLLDVKAEAKFAETHDDLDAEVLLAVGEKEAEEYLVAISGNLESTARLSRTMTARHYPSLVLSTRFFAGKDHYTVLPDVITSGISFLWREEIAKLPSSWPTPEQGAE